MEINSNFSGRFTLEGEAELKFNNPYRAFEIFNESSADVVASLEKGKISTDAGVVVVPAGASVLFAHNRLDVDTLYLSGSGKVQVVGRNELAPCFGGGGASAGSGESVDLSKYALKTDIPEVSADISENSTDSQAASAAAVFECLSKLPLRFELVKHFDVADGNDQSVNVGTGAHTYFAYHPSGVFCFATFVGDKFVPPVGSTSGLAASVTFPTASGGGSTIAVSMGANYFYLYRITVV